MKSNENSIQVGSRVFAKVKGYPFWPARVDEVVDQGPKKKHYLVFFYGTYEQAIVKPSDIVPYELKKDELGKEQKRKFFSEGMEEIEQCPNISIDELVEQGVLSREATEKIRAKLSKLKGEGGVESPVADAPATKKPRKEKDVLTPAPIVHGESTLSNSSTPPEERVSRSGRVIKPRKFIDEQEEGLALRGEPNATSTPAPGATRRGLRGRPVPPSPVVDKNAELGQISNGMDSSLSEGKPAASHEKLEAVPMTEPSPYDQGEERHSARHQTVRESLDSSEPKLTQRGKRGISESNKHSDSEATLPKRLKRQQQEKKFPVPSFDTSVKISPRDATAKIASRDGTDLHKEAKVAEDKTRATQVPVFKHLASKPDLEKVGAKNVAIVFEEKESQGEKKGKLEDSVKAETNYVTAEVTQPTRDVEKGSEKQMLGEIIPSISVITLEEVSPESMSETEHPIVVSEQTITLKSKPGQSEDEQKGKDEGTSVSGMPKRHQACLEVSEVEKPQTVTDIPGEAMKVPPFIISLTSDTTGKCLEQTQEGVVTQLRKCRVRMPREKKQQPRDISEAEKAKSKEKDCTEPEKKGKMKDTIPRVKEKGIGGEAALLSLLCKEKEAEKKGRAKDNVEPEKKDKDKGKGSPADMSPRKKTMLVKCASGDLVRVTCRNDLPKVFQNEEDEKFYEVRMKENMCCLESLLVRGVYIPPEVKKVMIERGDLSPDFKAHLIEDRKKWKKQVKLNWMKLEQAWSHMLKEVQGEQKKQPCDYDKLAAILKKAPSITQLAPLMLIKHPAIVHCIRKLREVKHNGVRKKSEDLYKQFKKLFVIPDGKQFVDVFQEKVKAFQEATKDMDVAKRFLVIRDPTLPREKAQIPYDSESEDDFDGFGNRGDEKLRQEKRSQEKEKNRGKEGEKKKDREREGKSGKEKKPKDETEKKPVQAKPEH